MKSSIIDLVHLPSEESPLGQYQYYGKIFIFFPWYLKTFIHKNISSNCLEWQVSYISNPLAMVILAGIKNIANIQVIICFKWSYI